MDPLTFISWSELSLFHKLISIYWRTCHICLVSALMEWSKAEEWLKTKKAIFRVKFLKIYFTKNSLSWILQRRFMHWNLKWQIKTENANQIVPSIASHRFFSSMYLRFITLTSRLAFALSFFNCVIRCSSLIGTFVVNCVLSAVGFCVEPLEADCAASLGASSSSSSSRILKLSRK